MRKEQKICEKCGSTYELTENSTRFRDKDTLECDICGTELISWNGGCVWSSKLLEKKELHLKKED